MADKVIENEEIEASPIKTKEEIGNEEIKPQVISDIPPHSHDGQNSTKINIDNLEANYVSVNEFVANTAQIKDAIITNAKIVTLAVSKLTAGTITSKTINLAVAAGTGDVYIAAGKTDFDNSANGFILGVDDSDSDLAKFYIGSTTVYWNFTGSAINIVGADFTAGTIKTATASADARIYLTGNTMRFMDAGVADARYDIEISSVGSRISFFDWVGATPSQTEQTRLTSDDDNFTIRRYDNEGANEKAYRFYDTYFLSIGADFGVTGVNTWKDAYFTGKLNSGNVSIVQGVNTGSGLYVSRDRPSTETNGSLAFLLNDNMDDEQKVLQIVQDGTGDAISIYNRDTTYASNPKAINILNYSNDNSIYIDHPANDDVNDIYAIYINCNNAGTKLPGGIDMGQFSAGEPLLKVPTDATDPTGAGGAAVGRIAIKVGATTRYIAYY